MGYFKDLDLVNKEHVEELDKVKFFIANPEKYNCFHFGSRALGVHTDSSDYDYIIMACDLKRLPFDLKRLPSDKVHIEYTTYGETGFESFVYNFYNYKLNFIVHDNLSTAKHWVYTHRVLKALCVKSENFKSSLSVKSIRISMFNSIYRLYEDVHYLSLNKAKGLVSNILKGITF